MILMCQQASLNTLDVPYEHTELKYRILDLDFSWITSVKQVFFLGNFFLLVLSLKITCLLHVPLHASMNFRNGFGLIRRHYISQEMNNSDKQAWLKCIYSIGLKLQNDVTNWISSGKVSVGCVGVGAEAF